MTPQDIVAILLAAAVLAFVAGGIAEALIYNNQSGEIQVNAWHDLIKVLIGGLIGYMAGSKK